MSPITTVSQLVDALGQVPFIPQALTRGTLLVLIALGLTRLLGRAPAAARHLVWSLAVGGLLLLPAIRLLPWRLELAALTAAQEVFDTAPSSRVADRSNTPTAEAPTAPTPDAASDAAIAPEPVSIASSANLTRAGSSMETGNAMPFSFSAGTIVLAIWAAGAIWMLGRLLMGIANVRRMVRRGHAASEEWQPLVDSAQAALGVTPRARIVISDHAAMPFTYGLFRPVIVLPSSAGEWTTERRRSVLLHELAHLRRRDLITNAIVQVACAVYWFHPLVMLAGRRVRIEAERSCDALVVAAGTRPSDYAGDLLEIARTMRSSATGAVALAMARRSDFEGRLLAILAPDSGRNALTAARAVLVALSFVAPAVAIAAAVPARHSSATTEREMASSGTTAGTPTESAPAPTQPGETQQDTGRHAALVEHEPLGERQTQGTGQARETAVPALLSVIRDSSAAVRYAAVEALGNLQDPRAVDALVQALRTDTDARVREAAAESLGEIDSPRAVPGLIAALGAERVAAVRAKIAWALGEIDDARAVDVLSTVVRDNEVEVRRQAVWALGEIGSPAGAPALMVALRDSDVETRKQAVWGLGETKSTDAITAISAATKDADAEVRKQAVEALGEIEDKRALPALEAATRDAEVEVRRAAIESIGQLDGVRTAPAAVIAATRDDDRGVRRAAAEALGQFEDEASVPALVPLTRDSSTEVKRAAVEALSSIGGARAIEVMAALLKDDDPEIRKLAAEALGKNR